MPPSRSCAFLADPLSRAEQLALWCDQKRRQLRRPAITPERDSAPPLGLEGMTELKMDVGVVRRPRQRRSVGDLGLLQPPRILEHVAVLDANVGAGRRERDRRPVGFCRRGIVSRIPQAVTVADTGFGALPVLCRCRCGLLGPERAELGSRSIAVGQQSRRLPVRGDRLLFAPGQLQQMPQLEVNVAVVG